MSITSSKRESYLDFTVLANQERMEADLSRREEIEKLKQSISNGAAERERQIREIREESADQTRRLKKPSGAKR